MGQRLQRGAGPGRLGPQRVDRRADLGHAAASVRPRAERRSSRAAEQRRRRPRPSHGGRRASRIAAERAAIRAGRPRARPLPVPGQPSTRRASSEPAARRRQQVVEVEQVVVGDRVARRGARRAPRGAARCDSAHAGGDEQLDDPGLGRLHDRHPAARGSGRSSVPWLSSVQTRTSTSAVVSSTSPQSCSSLESLPSQRTPRSRSQRPIGVAQRGRGFDPDAATA